INLERLIHALLDRVFGCGLFRLLGKPRPQFGIVEHPFHRRCKGVDIAWRHDKAILPVHDYLLRSQLPDAYRWQTKMHCFDEGQAERLAVGCGDEEVCGKVCCRPLVDISGENDVLQAERFREVPEALEVMASAGYHERPARLLDYLEGLQKVVYPL